MASEHQPLIELLLGLLTIEPDTATGEPEFRTSAPAERPCVGSGYCCKKVPCPYGSRDPSTGWCIHLEPWKDDTLDVPRYRCGRYEYIRTQPGNEIIPAFGAGCCSPLFNDDRDRIVRALRVVR